MKINIPIALTVLNLLLASRPNTSYAATVSEPGFLNTPAEIGKYKSAGEFIKLTAADINHLTGKKMNLLQRLSSIILKKQTKRALRKNPDLTVNEFLSAPHK